MSPEYDLLDQLCGMPESLEVARQIFQDDDRFCRSVEALLSEGEVVMRDQDAVEVPKWKWSDVLRRATKGHGKNLTLAITDIGAKRFA
jgi:hypothetical protein